jgi:hypothetical protein
MRDAPGRLPGAHQDLLATVSTMQCTSAALAGRGETLWGRAAGALATRQLAQWLPVLPNTRCWGVFLAQEAVHYERNPNYIFRKVVDELILVPIHQDVADMDCIYTLNGVGAFVWQKLDGQATPADLQVAVAAEFAADPTVIAADLESFLREMTAIGAVRRV